jgi:putative ABC transport system permease protein
MNQLLEDLRYGLRSLVRDWSFTAIAVTTLVLGIGANTSVFSIVNALLIRPYPFPDLDQVVLLHQSGPNVTSEIRIAPADFLDLQREAKDFQGLSSFQLKMGTLIGAGDPEAIITCAVSPNFFEVLGERAGLGRTFTVEEGEPGRSQVAILNYGYWQRRFAGDPQIVGRTITIDGLGFTVTGVMPSDFSYPPAVDIWTPRALTAQDRAQRNAQAVSGFAFQAIGRLRPGVSLAQGQSEVGAFASRLSERYPGTHRNRSLTLLRLREEQYQYYAALFLMLQAAALLVLLLASTNLINLLFARLITRRKELAIRMALGANRRRLARLFVGETIPVALIAGAVALWFSSPAVELVKNSLNPNYTKYVAGWNAIRVDFRVIVFAIAVTITVGLVFAVGAAWRAARHDMNDVLKETRSSSGAGSARLQSVLVMAQVVFATVLLVGAGLMVKGFAHLTDIYGVLAPDHVLTMRISLPEERYQEDGKVRALFERLLENLAALPGIESAGAANNLPASNVDNPRTLFAIEGRPILESESPSADMVSVSPDFFRSLRIRVLEGRGISRLDGSEVARVAVINRTMAKQFWPAGAPLGQRIRLGSSGSSQPWTTLVGVVDDVKQNWWENQPRPVIYLSYLQTPRRTMEFVVRTSADPLIAVSGVRRAQAAIDPNIAPAEGVNTLAGSIADSLAPLRILGILMMLFGAVALALAALGVYGILAQSVAQRKQEFGIRMALGAQRRDVLILALGQAGRLSTLGVVIGLILAFVLTRVMASLLFGVIAFDLLTFTMPAALLAVVALLAAYIPARRAARVDPMQALHDQ